MKLAVSNIAWDQHDDPTILLKLKELGISGIEVAPTKIWPDWKNASQQSAEKYKHKLSEFGFKVPAMQAILFGKPELQVFDHATHQKFFEHIKLIADLATGLEAKVLVFGSPKNRKRGQSSYSEASLIAQDFFSTAGDICQERGCIIGIEHNPVEYGCDFLTNVRDVSELTQQINHPSIKLHIDSAGIHMCGGSISNEINNSIPFVHYHISEPMLEPISGGIVNHVAAAKTLKNINYKHWTSIEMKQPANNEILFSSVSKALIDYNV